MIEMIIYASILYVLVLIITMLKRIENRIKAMQHYDHCPIAIKCRYGHPEDPECLKKIYDEINEDGDE